MQNDWFDPHVKAQIAIWDHDRRARLMQNIAQANHSNWA